MERFYMAPTIICLKFLNIMITVIRENVPNFYGHHSIQNHHKK